MAAVPDILFSNPLGLLALLSIIPLIILYLLRPKTIDLNVPSLLFFLKREQERNKLSLLLRKLIRDPMFLIQLLVLILLSLAIAGPYILEERVSGQHTVIVIDNSASMQANGRLDTAKELAAGRLSTVNSVVWAQNVPVLALKEGDGRRAGEVIELTPQRAVPSDVGAAITFAERLAGPGGTVLVFSDFAALSGDDPLVAKGLAEQNGVRVEFVQVGEVSGNVGIVNGWLDTEDGRYNLNMAVKNFNDKDEKIKLDILKGDEKRGGSLTVPAHSTRAYVVTGLGAGLTQVSIDNGGSMTIDDTAYVYIPTTPGGRILFVDARDQNPTKTALGLLGADIDYRTSLPGDLSGYGVVILGVVDNSSLGRGAAGTLTVFVENGGTLAATASHGIMHIPDGLLPANLTGMSNETDIRTVSESPLTGTIPFSDVEVVRHIRGTVPEGVTVLVEADDGSPVLSYWHRGSGTAVFIGLNDITGDDAWSGFASLPEFPLFWKNLLEWTGGTDVEENNVRTGTVIRLPSNQTVTCPDGSTLTTSSLWVDQAGVYSVGSQVVSANLYDARESDVDDFSIDAGDITSKYTRRPDVVRTETEKELLPYLIWVVLGLLLLELIIIYRRRELF